MALPMAVFADNSGPVVVTGTISENFALIVPTGFSLNGGTLVPGDNTGSAAGSVVTNAAGWTLTVADATSDFMEITAIGTGGTGTVGDRLLNPIKVSTTAGSYTTIADYSTALGGASGYSKTGTFNIPLFASQTVLATDAAGVYGITLTYTATPGH